MTAIVGFPCVDGVLILADTEETIGYSKSECEKIQRYLGKDVVLIIAGAGDSHFVEYESQRIQSELKRQGFRSWPETHLLLDDMARKFVRQNLRPYAGLEQEPEGIELLVGLYHEKETALFHWEHNAVRHVYPHYPISGGGGVEETHHMLNDLQDFYTTCVSTLLHGVRIMRQAKRKVRGVGGNIEAMILRNDGCTSIVGTHTTAALETLISDIEEFHVRGLLALISNRQIQPERLEQALGSLSPQVLEFRKRYEEIVRLLVIER